MRIGRWVGPALVAACLGCGPSDAPEPDGQGSSGASSPGAFELRAGDTLLDHLTRAEVVRWPATNLPSELVARAGHDRVRMVLPPVPQEAWGRVRNVPADWVGLLETVGDFRLWRTALPGPPPGDVDPRPEVRIGGQAPAEWTPGDGPPTGTVAWWDADAGALLALAEAPPLMVTVVRDVPGAAAWAGVEGAARPDGPELQRHVDPGGRVVRSGLWAPAPATLRWSVDTLTAERLELVTGRLLRGWSEPQPGVLRATAGESDGVRFAVELRVQPEPGAAEVPAFERLWERDELPTAEASPAASVDLSAWRGRSVELQLLTEPLGHAHSDYAYWGDLRLRGGAEHAPAQPHVVLIDLDTLRADRLGVYGSEAGLTPQLDAWAAGATVFRDALAPASWTLPSTVSMFTGLAVHQHGITRGTQALGEQVPTLAARLRAAGYETRGVNAGGYLRPTFGLDEGFDVYETADDPKDMDWQAGLATLAARDSERPLFLMLHTYFVHAPYDHDAGFAGDYDGAFAGQDVDYDNVLDPFRRGELALSDADGDYVEAMYDALVARMDQHLGPFLAGLDAALDGQPALVIITSDHGEAFLEHDLLGHGEALWDELLRVPLIVRFPDGRAGVDARPASLVDIVPTVLDVVGLEIPGGLAGQSLAAPPPAGRPRVRMAALDDGQRATTSEGLTLLQIGAGDDARVQLFDLRSDPGQTRDLSDDRGDTVQDMLRRRTWFEGHFPEVQAARDALGDLSDADIEQLRALGYLGDDDPR